MSRTPLPPPTPERMSSHYAEAMRRGSPVARKTHDGQYGELTPLRQRGGSGWQSGHPLPYPLSFEVVHLGIRDALFLGFSCSCSCSVDDGDPARIRALEYDYEHHFIEHEYDFVSRSSISATSKSVHEGFFGCLRPSLTLRVVINPLRCGKSRKSTSSQEFLSFRKS